MRHNLIMAIPHIKYRKRMCICHINMGLLWHMAHTTTCGWLWIYVHISWFIPWRGPILVIPSRNHGTE